VRALCSIEQYCVGSDYWEDKTIKKCRAAGLVELIDNRIMLTDAGRQVAAAAIDWS
jgi:hypothetical protein